MDIIAYYLPHNNPPTNMLIYKYIWYIWLHTTPNKKTLHTTGQVDIEYLWKLTKS